MKAYPIMYKHPTTGLIVEEQGMELRDWFAGQALTKLIGSADIDVTVKSAYLWADAMMKQREGNND
jgi:hypothetical protein